MMLVRVMPVICWISRMLTPAATASRTTSSRIAFTSAQWRSLSCAFVADERAMYRTLAGNPWLIPPNRRRADWQGDAGLRAPPTGAPGSDESGFGRWLMIINAGGQLGRRAGASVVVVPQLGSASGEAT